MAEKPDSPLASTEASTPAPTERQTCLDCGTDLPHDPVYKRYRVCPSCRFHYYLSSRERVALLTDTATFHETNEALVSADEMFSDDTGYRERRSQAQRVTGLLDAVLTGTGYIGGMPAVLAIVDFGFMNGSLGSVGGEKITLAAELAAEKRYPFVLVVSGGAPRFQEGALALMQMPKMVAAVNRLNRRGIPFISILASPTTGQLYVGPASMADIILAEPGALIGYAPLTAARQATRGTLPHDFHTAEFHLQRGMVDRIVDRQSLKQQLALLLDLLGFRYRLTVTNRARAKPPMEAGMPAWDRVQRARHLDRPTSCDYIERIAANFVELHGDRNAGDDPAVVAGLGYLAGEAVAFIGQERGRGDDAAKRREGRIYPEGFRKAERVMRMAARFKLPVVTFVDTPGPYQGLEAEERGIGTAVASAMAAMLDLKIPTLSVIIGQGGSEAALAMGTADRTMMLENAICTPVAPEAAAWILYRDVARTEEVASALKLTAEDCKVLGIVETVVPEPEGGAHKDFDSAARLVEQVLVENLLDLQMTFSGTLLRSRYLKFRKAGAYSTAVEAHLASEAMRFQDVVKKGFRDFIEKLRGEAAPHPDTPQSEVRRIP